MATIQKVIDLVEKHPDLADPYGSTSEEALKRAEKELGLSFPPSYRDFVANYGCLDFGAQEFYGLTGEHVEGIPNVVWSTLDARRKGLPPYMVKILDPAVGDMIFCIDTSHVDSTGESPVVEWIEGASFSEQNLEPFAANFADFAVAVMNIELEIEAGQDETLP